VADSLSFLHPRDEILATMDRIYRSRMTTTSGGNLSIREANGDIWITPARVDKGSLRREDIVCVHPGGAVDGPHPPSSEFPFHKAIYEARPDAAAVVHAHPVALVAFSLVHAVPDTRLFHQARHVCGEAGFADYRLPGSAELGESIAATMRAGFTSVILENHGVVTHGASLAEAFHRFETLEFTGKTLIKARLLGEPRMLTGEQIELAERPLDPMPAFTRGAASSRECELRDTLCRFVRRAYRQRLFISTQGSFSARLDEDSFLITQYQVDRGLIEPGDLVLIRGGRAEAGTTPSRAARSHAEIYRRQPEVGAVINAYPVNATAFSVTGTELDTRTIPESFVVLRTVGRAPYGLQFEDPAALASLLSHRQPALLLENDGALVTGKTVLEAFDRLEVLESTAEAIINSQAVGARAPMSEARVRELERAFGLD
jgi:L-fuculose-phosphate aldolase